MIPSTPIYTPTPYLMSNAVVRARSRLAPGCYNAAMTLLEITYELQSPLTQEQLRLLGEFSNTYGLRRFRFDESKKHLSFEYDASRIRDTQIAHVLGRATIAVARKVTETGAQPEFKN
jgi:hypothetical protein